MTFSPLKNSKPNVIIFSKQPADEYVECLKIINKNVNETGHSAWKMELVCKQLMFMPNFRPLGRLLNCIPLIKVTKKT
jgi:hypothetical protein